MSIPEKKQSLKEESLLVITNKIEEMKVCKAIDIPSDYSIGNAIQAAWFTILEVKGNKDAGYKPAIEICTKKSIQEAMFRMCTEGLNPMKKQCYFIIYKSSNEYNLTYMRSYQGTIALAKRLSGVKDVIAREVYKGEKYSPKILPSGRKILDYHEQSLSTMTGDIIGGYVIVVDKDGIEHLTEMPMSMIKKAWEQGMQKGNGDVHKNFTDEMVKRTLINRALKQYVNSSSDENIIEKSEERESLKIPSNQCSEPKKLSRKTVSDAEVVEDVEEEKHSETELPSVLEAI